MTNCLFYPCPSSYVTENDCFWPCKEKFTLSQNSAFYQSLSKQMVTACEERWQEIGLRYSTGEEAGGDETFIFIGGLISALCRRGHAG